MFRVKKKKKVMQQGPPVLDAMGSLSAVDPVRRILYYLGASNVASQLAIHATIGEDADHNVNNTTEGLTGATALVGIDLDSGEVLCSGALPLTELSYVGLGQSISWDQSASGGDASGVSGGGLPGLVITGLAGPLHHRRSPLPTSATRRHGQATLAVLRTKGCDAGGNIAPIQHVGFFGDAENARYPPVLHSSAFDAGNQRLFLTVGTAESVSGIGVLTIDSGDDGGEEYPKVPNLPFFIISLDAPACANMVRKSTK